MFPIQHERGSDCPKVCCFCRHENSALKSFALCEGVHFCPYGSSTPLHSDSISSELEPIPVSTDAAEQDWARSSVFSHQRIGEKSNYYTGLRLQVLAKNIRDKLWFGALWTWIEHQGTIQKSNVFFSNFFFNRETWKSWCDIQVWVINHLDLRLKQYLCYSLEKNVFPKTVPCGLFHASLEWRHYGSLYFSLIYFPNLLL